MIDQDVTYDANTVSLMGRVCDDAWSEMVSAGAVPSVDQFDEVRRQMARCVLGAVAAGEIDPSRLKEMALAAATG